ncbi:MAG: hypothetical protein J7604_14605 [Sporocytophaga sp.]|uniref:hypothetical protein n=1 Tax=Sporocytophaga sp. TaxID=2231183 RepID=UPI001B03D10A|nr:hypothetical protein [Sporocytophaga sp.]MBO9701437.1 hypothetical protein [Sporocytophaga sp.]
MNFNNLSILFFLSIALSLTACKKDDGNVANPENPNENEMITTVQVLLTNTANSTDQTKVTFRQMQGLRTSLSPFVETMRLKANTTYSAEIFLLDESKTPADTISNEVREEGDEHQFFFKVENANLTVSYDDADKNGVPIGLKNIVKTGEPSIGSLEVILKHQGEEKPKSGNGNELLGSTDVDVNFTVEIE